VKADIFVGMIARQVLQPHLVFLAASQSATRSKIDAFAGLCPKFVQAGIPVVIGMQGDVTSETVFKSASSSISACWSMDWLTLQPMKPGVHC